MFKFDADLEDELSELEGAEDFLNYFELPFDQTVVHANRLHILQRYHDYIVEVASPPEDEAQRKELYGQLLAKAYQDFVHSNPKDEKVLQIYKSLGKAVEPGFVSLDSLLK